MLGIGFVGIYFPAVKSEHRVERSLFPNSDTRCLFVECAFSVYAEARASERARTFWEEGRNRFQNHRGLNFAWTKPRGSPNTVRAPAETKGRNTDLLKK